MQQKGLWQLALVLFTFISLSVFAAPSKQASKKPRGRLKLTHVYLQEPRYICSVTNRATGRTFFGTSPKLSLAKVYARTLCQMISYRGQCFVKTNCNHDEVMVRKRRFVRVTS